MKRDFNYELITGLHLELTTKCNAMCPMCNRNFKGRKREKLKLVELSLSDIKKLLPKYFLKQLKLISLCGVYGDPICNSEIQEIIKYFYECNSNIDIDLYTNGGLHDENWWRDLAKIFKNYNGTVIFGIDGDENTHSLHRCNTDYDKVIKNAKIFINAGGTAEWDFLVFKHNEHLVKKAEQLSKKIGFKTFQIKKSGRFLKTLYEHDENLDSTIEVYGKHPVYNKDGNIEYYIELPKNKKYVNNSEQNFTELIKEYGSINKYFDKVEIDCSAIKSKGIFMSADGEVFPCCTVYQQVCYKTIHGVKDKDELNEYNLYIKDDLSAFNKPIKKIVEGDFFSSLYKCFNCNSISQGKPKSCSRACGRRMNIHSNGHTKKIKYEGK